MGSESDEVLIEDSDEWRIFDKELNDSEFDIPSLPAPSLESVLWDMESEEGSDSASLHSFQSMTAKFRSRLYHCILQGISAQITSAGERVNAGLPTVITNSNKFVAIGTSHGYVLSFDSEQKLCWCCYDKNSSDQGAISALAFNLESTRLLVGYERGFISMVDAANGDVIRRLADAHAPQTAVLHLRFTFLNNLALCGDSSGCVFSLTFNRRLGVRSWDSKCLFSGARGEVCVFEPLVQGYDLNFLNNHVLVAMATLSKVIVISIRPRLKVLFSHQLPKTSKCLPLISWQLVSVGRSFQPVLAWGRNSELNYMRVISYGPNNKKIRLLPLRNVQLHYSLLAIHWLGTRHLLLLDTNENLHLLEVRNQRDLEILELANVRLVYSSAHFKALAVGGGVSEAFALAGERACYNSLSSGSRADQLLILGTNAVHLIKLRTWPERLMFLSEQGRWTEALNLAADEGGFINKEKFTAILLRKYLDNLNENRVDKDSLTAAVNCCVKLNKIDILSNELLEAVSNSNDLNNQQWYFTLLTDHITNGALSNLSPTLAQLLVLYLEKLNNDDNCQTLENVLLNLDVTCLDLHQVLSICKRKKLYTAWIHITTRTMSDYTGPLTEFLLDLTPTNHRLGNTLLVYVSSCLAGLAYPSGQIPKQIIPRVKYDVLRCLETLHSIHCKIDEPTYPYLRALLKYNTRECLNVIELAFNEVEFTGEMGLLQRQRLVDILMEIVVSPEFSDSQIINLACFISRLITSNNLNVEDDEIMMETVVKRLTLTNNNLSVRDHNEREQSWLDLLNAKKITHLTSNDLLQLALKSKCYRVVEYFYEFQKDYSQILKCYLDDPIRKYDVFDYILNNFTNTERCIDEQFTKYFKQLVELDAKKTANIIIEHYQNSIEKFTNFLLNDDSCSYQLQYEFLNGIVATNDFKFFKSPDAFSESYLELLCKMNKDRNVINNFVKTSQYLHIERGLEITRKYQIDIASAVLLEKSGHWMEALELLLKNDLIDESVALCIRGGEHLDSNGAQELWLNLLKHKKNQTKPGTMSLRQLLHAAAPHVPPTQLFELISNANFGDVKILLKGILTDYTHDIFMFETTFKLLGKDLHHCLAKTLTNNRKGLAIKNLICYLCQKSLYGGGRINIENEQSIVSIWGCGHCFHENCLKTTTTTQCPHCQLKAVPLLQINNGKEQQQTTTTLKYSSSSRPDLEGNF